MSEYNLNEPNNFQTRYKSVRSDEFWVKDPEGEGFIPLLPGGGGSGGDLPYYLKSNSVDIDDGSNGSELTASALTFGDSSGNSSLNKGKVDLVTKLKTGVETVTVPGEAGNLLVTYNPATNTFTRNPTTATIYSALAGTSMMLRTNPLSIFLKDPNTSTNLASGYVYVSSSQYSTNAGLVAGGPTVGGYLVMLKGGVNTIFDSDSAIVANKLKVIDVATPGANSKMMIYDTSTKAFNYSDIPSGGSVAQYYLKNNSIEIDNPANGTPQRFLCKNGLNVTTMSSTNFQVTNGDASQVNITSLSSGGNIYIEKKSYGGRNLTVEDVDVTNKLKALASTTPGVDSKMMIYNTGTQAFNYSEIPAQKNKYIKYTPPNAVSLPLASEASLVSPYTAMNYGVNRPRRFLNMSEPDDTLWIDLANDGRTASFNEVWHLPLVLGVDSGLSQANTITAVYTGDAAITLTVRPNVNVTYTPSGLTMAVNAFVISITLPAGKTLNGLIRITIQRPTLPNRLPGIVETAPSLA